MSTSPSGTQSSATNGIAAVECSESRLIARLTDGREISAPLTWYPRLQQANADERANWKLVGGGYGVHWPDVDEDVSLQMLLEGLPSIEANSTVK